MNPKVKELAEKIASYKGKTFTLKQIVKLNEQDERFQFRLKELQAEASKRQKKLTDEMKVKEDKIKVKSMEEVLRIINENTK